MSDWIPNVTTTEARGNVAPPSNIDHAAVIIGTSSAGTVGLSPLFNNSVSIAAAYGEGNGVDACTFVTDPLYPDQQIPGPIAFYKSASTTPGAYGTPDVTGVTGSGVMGVDATVFPYGDYQATLTVVDPFTIGAAGGSAVWTLDNGVTPSPKTSIGVLDYFQFPKGNVRVTFSEGSTDLTALNTLINEEFGDFNAHVILTTGTVHTNADSGNVVSAGTYPSATNTVTRVARINALRAAALLHFPKGTGGSPATHINVSGDAAGVTALSAVPVATDDESALTLALAFKTILNAHDANVVAHTIADATNVVTSPAPNAGSFNAGDVIKVTTTGPRGTTADLDIAATDMANSNYDFSQILVTWPLTASEAAHVTTMLNTLRGRGKRVEATIFSRGPNVAEPEATWGTAVATDYAAFNDDRIEVKEGMPALVTDPVSARVYLRTWAPAYFARMLAQPSRRAWTGSPSDGGLPGVALYNSAGALVGHDETGTVFTGLGDATGQGNRFGCLFRGATPETRLQVFTTAPWVAWSFGGRVFLAMARRIVNALTRAAVSVSFAQLGGTAFYETDPATQVTTLLPEYQEAIHSTLFDFLTPLFQDDLENFADADNVTGLVQVQSVVAVAYQLVTIPINLAPKVGGWIIKIPLTITLTQ